MLSLLNTLKSAKQISELNFQFAKLINEKQQPYNYSQEVQDLAVFVACLVSYNVMQGNTALRLDTISRYFGLNLESELLSEITARVGSPDSWQRTLAQHIAFSDNPERITPLLFQNGLLYFYRYWQAEHRVASYLLQAVKNGQRFADLALAQESLAWAFQDKIDEKEPIDWQKIGVATALTQRFCLISGGPGTGKTTTVARLLAALQYQQLKQGAPQLTIALSAPTGKAAARLKESLQHSIHQLELPSSLVLPDYASTLHRLLGIRPLNDTPKYHAQNPLQFDVLVVDEASMIDLFLMEKLMNALKPSTRLILLGDKDQLASVEAGAILGELGEFITSGYSSAHCQTLHALTGYNILPTQTVLPAICDSLCHLRKSYRFDDNSGIGYLAKQINAQQTNTWQAFQAYPDVLNLIEYPTDVPQTDAQQTETCVKLVVDKAVELYRDYLTLVKARVKDPQAVKIEQIFAAFQKTRLLCALRVSELGVEHLNQRIAEALRAAGLINFSLTHESYVGKPILVTENSTQNRVFSGDIGLILTDEQGLTRVYFDTQNEEGEPLSLSPNRLPAIEPAFAMTVHKSQGSEFEHTLLVLPRLDSPILTKELLYTAVTRSKVKFSLFGSRKIWEIAVKRQIIRQSGLREQLNQA